MSLKQKCLRGGVWVMFVGSLAVAANRLEYIQQYAPDKPDPSVEFFTKGVPKLYATLQEE